MRQAFFILIAWLCVIHVHAQSSFSWLLDNEGKIIVLPKNQKKYEITMPKTTYKSFSPFTITNVKSKTNALSPAFPAPENYERPMDMHIASKAYQPFFEAYLPMLQHVNPLALDFCETYIKQLNDRFDLIANGFQYTWGGLGGITFMGSAVSWHNDQWRLHAGGFAGRSYTLFNPNPDVSVGVNIQLDYQANDWLRLSTWGQYAYYDEVKQNPHLMPNPYFNHSVVGGAFNVKVSDNFSFGVGFNYDYNRSQNRGNRSYLYYPAF